MTAIPCLQCHKPLPSATSRFCPECGAAQSRAMPVFGDYEAIEVLGQGGMGRVYRAVQRRLNREVCIKTLLPQLAADEAVARRFQREATTMAALAHPNIVQVFDVGQAEDGSPYIAMELVQGRTLREILRDESPVPVPRAVRLMDQILAGLSEAHTRGVVHRDLKPGNVLVSVMRDGGEVCKLVDFGIAQVLDEADGERLTRTGMIVGTPGYMAPEQITGEPVDARADLYSAGVLLYELITGRRVFKAPTESELLKKALVEKPELPSARTPQNIPRALDAVCLKALEVKPGQRFGSATDFREALKGVERAPGPMQIELATKDIVFTPLAVAVAENAEVATDSRTILAAVLNAADEWERARLLEPFERVMRQALLENDHETLRQAVEVLQREHAEKGMSDNVRALFEAMRVIFTEGLGVLFEQLLDPARGSTARYFIRLLGKGAIPELVARASGASSEVQRAVMQVVHAMDPDCAALVAQCRTSDAKGVKLILEAASGWPGDEGFPLFSALVGSPEPSLRIAALHGLNEQIAFRLGTVIRQRLHDPVAGVRAEAIRWVVRLQDEGAVGDLDRILSRSTIDDRERQQVWRALGMLRSERSVGLLVTAFFGAREPEQLAELATLLVRSKSPAAVEHVRALHGKTLNQKLKRALSEALREA